MENYKWLGQVKTDKGVYWRALDLDIQYKMEEDALWEGIPLKR